MNTRLASACALAGLVLTPPAFSQQQPAQAPRMQAAPAMQVLTPDDLGPRRLNDPQQLLGELRAHTIQQLNVPMEEAPEQFSVVVSINDRPQTLHFVRYSVREPGMKHYIELGHGQVVEFDPGPDRTYVGTVAGSPQSIVTATVMPGGRLTARIKLNDEELWHVEEVTALGNGKHVVYNNSDGPRLPPNWCGVQHAPQQGHQQGQQPQQNQGGFSTRSVSVFKTLIDIEADFEWFDTWGSDWFTEISGIINDANAIFLIDTAICLRISESRVWMTNVDPYPNSDANSILSTFRDNYYYQPPRANGFRTAAHLFSSKDFDGTTAGLAYVGGIRQCGVGGLQDGPDANSDNVPDDILPDGFFNRYGSFGITQDLNGRSRRTHIFAHELGHNWNAAHCDGTPTCDIMRAIVPLTGSTTFGSFSSGVMIARRNEVQACARECDFSGFQSLCTGYCQFSSFESAITFILPFSTLNLYAQGRPGVGNLPWDAANVRVVLPMRIVAPNEPVRLR